MPILTLLSWKADGLKVELSDLGAAPERLITTPSVNYCMIVTLIQSNNVMEDPWNVIIGGYLMAAYG